MSCRNDNCGKIAIRVQRIYNGASLLTRGSFVSTPTGFTPAQYTLPLSYISAKFSGDVPVTAYNVTPVAGSTRSRVSLSFSYDVIIEYTDAAGVKGSATARIDDSADILITLPSEPYTLSASVEFASVIGSITPERADITACRRLRLRVLVPYDLLVCPAGIVVLPEACQTEDLVCRQLD